MRESFRKHLLSALLLLVMILLMSSSSVWAATGGRMGGRLRSPPPPKSPPYKSPSPPPSSPSYRSSPGRSYFYRSSYDDDEVTNLKYQVSDLKCQVNDLKRDLNKASDSTKNTSHSGYDKASDSIKGRIQFYHVLLFVTGILSIATLFWLGRRYYMERPNISVLKLQFGLLGLMRLLQKDLNRIAETADTDTEHGLKSVLTETTNLLFRQVYSRNDIYALYAHSSVKSSSESNWEEKLNKLSDEERRKFDKETLVNLNNKINKRNLTKSSRTSSNGSNEFMVVTVLVAAKGKDTLPFVHNIEDLKKALEKLASIPSTRLKGVEVLWTPQEEDDTLTDQEFWRDYPLLQLL